MEDGGQTNWFKPMWIVIDIVYYYNIIPRI
jgi:hypothetical protein